MHAYLITGISALNLHPPCFTVNIIIQILSCLGSVLKDFPEAVGYHPDSLVGQAKKPVQVYESLLEKILDVHKTATSTFFWQSSDTFYYSLFPPASRLARGGLFTVLKEVFIRRRWPWTTASWKVTPDRESRKRERNRVFVDKSSHQDNPNLSFV